MKRMKSQKNVYFIGIITGIRKLKTRNKKTMIILTFEDQEGKIEGILFSGVKINATIKENETVWVRGVIEQDNDPKSNKTANQIKINELLSIDKVIDSKTTDVEVYIEDPNDLDKLNKLKEIAEQSDGNKNLILSLPFEDGRAIAKSNRKFAVSSSKVTLNRIRTIFGFDSVRLSNRSARLSK